MFGILSILVSRAYVYFPLCKFTCFAKVVGTKAALERRLVLSNTLKICYFSVQLMVWEIANSTKSCTTDWRSTAINLIFYVPTPTISIKLETESLYFILLRIIETSVYVYIVNSFWSRVSSFGIATYYGLDDREIGV